MTEKSDPYISLEGKTALVTGASQGIGLAVAQLFVRYGAQVAMIDHSGRSFKEAEQLGAQAIAVRCDVADEPQVKRAVATVLNQFEKIDILVNNAGSIVRKNVVDTTAEEWDTTMNVGVRGTFLFSKYVIPHMASQGGGIIINTSSNCAIRATEGAASYNAVKGAISALTRGMAIDHAAQNIRINCVCPGDVLTPMLIGEGVQTGRITTGTPQTDEERATWEAFLRERGGYRAMGRISTPEEIAYTYLFLATGMSGYATGSSIVVDGGRAC